MTACVNKKSKRVAAVVTASLVGALSIGAPAVALAANNTSIDLQFAEGGTDGMEFVNGTINFKFSDATGNALNSSLVGTDTKGNTTVEAPRCPSAPTREHPAPPASSLARTKSRLPRATTTRSPSTRPMRRANPPAPRSPATV